MAYVWLDELMDYARLVGCPPAEWGRLKDTIPARYWARIVVSGQETEARGLSVDDAAFALVQIVQQPVEEPC